MKIFVDTNIFLDFLLNRDNADHASSLLKSVQHGLFDAYIADISLINIAYIAKKQSTNIKQFIHFVNQHFTVLGANNLDIEEALQIDNNDFEDNVQYQLAKKSFSEVIISNDASFYQNDIEVKSSKEFIALS